MGRKTTTRRTLWRSTGIFGLFMLLAYPCFGAVVFEDNFDSKPDWNANMSINGTACTPPSCPAAPSGWDGYRVMPSTGASGVPQTHNVPVASIQRPIGLLPDHSGTGAGKALIVYQASDLPDEPSVWKGDGQIAKVLGQEYPELYIRYWVRSQAGWKSTVGGALKTFRVTNWPGASVSPNMFDQGFNNPTLFVDQSTWGSWAGAKAGFGAFFPAYRCSASPDDYFCANSGNSYEGGSYGDDWLVTPNGPPTTNYADTGWHRYDVHVKVNTIGQKNGIMTIAYDGATLLAHNDMVFLESGSTRHGFNTIFLGGNSHNNYTQNGNQWYAMDDVVVSTTAIPDNYVIGGGTPADTTAPTVSISAPVNGASVTGTVSATANATDNVGVSKVEFYVNGTLQVTDTASPYLYSWNTSALNAGTYTLTAKAYDAAGNVGSSSVSVSVVKDTTAPTVSMTAPANGATVSGTVALTASATDNIGVTKVEFYGNGALLSATNVAPYSYSWNTAAAANGSYTLTAKAYDAAGNVGQSSSVAVTISNATADTTAPSVASFTMPSTATSLSVPVSGLSATDNVGVTGYMISESSTKPAATATGWTASAPTSFTFAGAGTRTAYAWAKDAAGNVSASASASVTITLPTTTPAPVAGLVAAYSFDEGTGTTVNDKSGKGNNGTIKNATWTGSGRYGSALSFNGTSSMVNIPDSASLHLTSAMTLEAWVKASNISSKWQDVIYKGNENYYLEATSTYSARPMGAVQTGNGLTGSYAASSLAANTWTHLAATYDGSYVRFYVNGVLASTQAKSGSMATSTNPLQIGGDSIYGEYFAGTIDEIRVYNIALGQSQIQSDMATRIGL